MTASDLGDSAVPDDGESRLGVAEVLGGDAETLMLLRGIDWAQTPLGPVEQWPPELSAAVRMIMPSRVPMLLWWGPDLIQLYNDAYRPLVGTKHPTALAQPAAECWAEAWADMGPLAEAVLRDGQAQYAEDKLLLLDRHDYLEETYWTFSYSPVRDHTDKVAGVFVAATDVTARLVGDRRLATVRELGGLSAAYSGSAAEICRAAAHILAANRAAVPFAAIYLAAEDGADLELVASYGVGNSALTPGLTVRLDRRTAVGRAAVDKQRAQVTGLQDGPDAAAFDPGPLGDQRPDVAMVLPVTTARFGKPRAVVVLGANPYRAVDNTYRTFFNLVARQLSVALTDVLAYEEQRARAAALTELDTEKTRFFQNISHEFRTPLTMILGPLRSLLDQDGVDLGHERDSVEGAWRAAERLRKLVDHLLEYLRAEADQLHAQVEPTDLAVLTVDLVSMFRSTVESAGLTLLVDCGQSGDVVPVDPEMWSRIVLNLLSNAIKYTPSGTIDVRLSVLDESIELTVADTGIGIPEEQLVAIFGRFRRANNDAARTQEGSGIGLSLVADLVRAHGGQVSVTSEIGAGSTFRVSIPRRPNPVTSRPVGRPADGAASGFVAEADSWIDAVPAGHVPAPVAASGSILLVEDNADLRGYLSRLLGRQGWSVIAVGDVGDALGVRETVDLVLSDVMLPGRSGLDLVRMMRADPALSRIPVILLTARAGTEAAVEGLRSGADDYVVKPFDPNELIARVAVHYELAKLRDYALSQADQTASNLRAALASNRQIGAAIGILMARLKITEDEAFDALRSASQHLHRKLRDVADEVVTTGDLPTAP